MTSNGIRWDLIPSFEGAAPSGTPGGSQSPPWRFLLVDSSGLGSISLSLLPLCPPSTPWRIPGIPEILAILESLPGISSLWGFGFFRNLGFF